MSGFWAFTGPLLVIFFSMAVRDTFSTLYTLAVQQHHIWIAGHWDGLSDIAVAASFVQISLNYGWSWHTVAGFGCLYAGSVVGTRLGFLLEDTRLARQRAVTRYTPSGGRNSAS